jgi:hypothetical protein
LKLKFHELYHEPLIKSSFRIKYENYTKKIKGFIDPKAKIIINNIDNNKYLNNNENINKLQ